MDRPAYRYRARCESVTDGDTLRVTVDLGFHCYHVECLRLEGIDTAEVRGPERPDGIVAKAFAKLWVDTAGTGEWPLIVETRKGETFGRYVADVYRADNGESLADALRAAGFDKGAVA